MSHSSAETAKRRLLADFNSVVAEADQLLKLVTDEGGDRADAFRSRVGRSLDSAKNRLRSIEDAVMDTTRATARATDEYVHENPWQTVGAAAAVGAIFGAVISLLISRR